VFVSDLHFTQSGPLADFQAGDALHDLVASIRDHPGEVILALGGDIVDLLQIRGPRAKAVPHILAGPDAVALGAALHDLAKRPGVTIVYLVGTTTLRWPGTGKGGSWSSTSSRWTMSGYACMSGWKDPTAAKSGWWRNMATCSTSTTAHRPVRSARLPGRRPHRHRGRQAHGCRH
jgi:hypothetical protein